MDEAASLILHARLAALLLCAAFGAACASSNPPLTAAPAEDFIESVELISQARGLPWRGKITLSPADFTKRPESQGDLYHGAPIADVEAAYKAIGLLDAADDLKKAMADAGRLELFTHYDPARGRATWSPVAAQLGAALAQLDQAKARNPAPAFAIVHALQEQHFHWRAALDRLAGEDRRSALAAVAAGDAMLTLLLQGQPLAAPKLESSDAVADAMDRLSAGLPELLRRRLSFPHRHGARFVYWAYRANGWRGVDGLYADPPRATAEILRPETYFLRREPPLRFFPPQLLRRFRQPAVVEQTAGEDAVAGLLTGAYSGRRAAEIAAGWRGDQLFHFSEIGSSATLWFTAWDTEKQAEQFSRAYRTLLQLRHRIRLKPAKKGFAAETRTRDRGWLLQRNGDLVLLVSAAANVLDDLAADAWKDLEVDRDQTELRFEVSSAQSQFSLRTR